MRPNKIGYSVSRCILSLIRGDVLIEDVAVIIGGTRLENRDQMERAIEDYRETTWEERPDLGEYYFRKLFEDGRIIQWRLGHCPMPVEQFHKRVVWQDAWTPSRSPTRNKE